MNNRDYIENIRDFGLCIQNLVKTRFNKDVKLIFTKGRYKSMYVSFYKNHLWQFYIEDKQSCFEVYLLKDNKIVRKDTFLKKETVERFYQKMMYFFRMI